MNKIDFTYHDKFIFAKLFHALPMEESYKDNNFVSGIELMNEGIVFASGKSGVVQFRVHSEDAEIVEECFGLDNSIWSSSFHKTWDKVATASHEQLLFEQILNYVSTYGMELMGMKVTPMIPVEAVVVNLDEVPNINAFTLVRYVSKDEAIALIEDYLRTTVAPHKNQVDDIIRLMRLTKVKPDEVKSYELKAARYSQLDMVPQEPEEFLRYLVYIQTGKITLIKDRATVHALKTPSTQTYNLLQKADQKKLASIFYRYKPLFLALKSHPKCGSYINKLRRMADTYHRPMNDVNVQNLTKLYMQGRYGDFNKVLKKCSNRQLIKLYNYALSESLSNNTNMSVYNIRNGKVYVQEHIKTEERGRAMCMIARIVSDTLLAKCMSLSSLNDKIFYIPSFANYAAPVTEKQFVGNIPYGSRFDMAQNSVMIPAVHWTNFKGRTDLDLHLQSLTQAFGWNASYRSEERDVLYSGDMTDATHGAVEAYRLNPSAAERYVLTISNFTGTPNVSFEFFMANKEEHFNFARQSGYYRHTNPDEAVCDVKDALFAPIPMKFDSANSQTIGLFNGHAFYFYGGELGENRVPKTELYKDFLRGCENRMKYRLDIDTLIRCLGGTIVDETTFAELSDEQKAQVIDLSPANLTARSLLDIVDSDIQ